MEAAHEGQGGHGGAAPLSKLVVKLVLIGDASVGKTSLAMQLCLKRFYEDQVPTIGGAFFQRVLVAPLLPHSPPHDVRLDLWDTAGTPKQTKKIYSQLNYLFF
jgi:GTPase SAR1 family protein